jgi:hypothetical protein
METAWKTDETLADAARRELEKLPDTDVRYAGTGFPVLAVIHYLKPHQISGPFHVERMLADYRGEFGAILEGPDGKLWAVYDLDALEWT